jgi:NAD(P)-dependent dehydrogenase (short-subunit alcohol dehydrogenase family)
MLFAKNGCNVAVLDIDRAHGEETKQLIESAGGVAQFIPCDVGSGESVGAAIAQCISRFGSIDYAFNNAGTEGHAAMAGDLVEEDWNTVININLTGIWRCMNAELPHMLQAGHGVIINCASIAGLVGFPSAPAYVASKHGVVGLTKNAALD